MTIEEHIKKAMGICPLTEIQEGLLLDGIENYLNELEQLKNCNLQNVTISVCCENCKQDDNKLFYPCKRCKEFDQFKAK